MATVRILEVLSEGPIYGAQRRAARRSGRRSISTARRSSMRSGNAQFFIKEGYFREGWPSQDAIPGYPMGEAPFAVGVQVHTGSPVVRALNTPTQRRALHHAQIPALYGQMDNGDVTTASVTYAFDIKVDGGDWANVVTEQISGKTMSPYQRAVRVQRAVHHRHAAGPHRPLRSRAGADDPEQPLLVELRRDHRRPDRLRRHRASRR